jgi:hypothetical protein
MKYRVLVDGEVIADNVPRVDIQHKVEMVRAYCNLLPEHRFSRVTTELITDGDLNN